MSTSRNDYTRSLTVPRIIHRAVFSELWNAVFTTAPKWTVLVHIPHDNAIIMGRIRVRRVEVLIGDSCPAHTTFTCTIDDTRVNLAKAGLDVVMESRTDVDASRPHLYVANDCI